LNDIAITDPCILFALAREASPLLREFRPNLHVAGAPCWARFCGPSWLSILVLRTGMGVANTEKALSWLLESAWFDEVPLRPKVVISAGYAGALRDEHHIGDVILATEIVDEEGGRWPTTWPATLPAGTWQPPLQRARILTARRMIAKVDDKRRLGDLHQSGAVDMESAVVARWCHHAEVPFGCVRAISDEAGTELSPQLENLLTGGKVSLLRLATSLIRSPRLIAEMWPLARNTRHAARQLGKALGELLTLTTPLGNDAT
jgi:adenosylhomocysteine nucleosidase